MCNSITSLMDVLMDVYHSFASEGDSDKKVEV